MPQALTPHQIRALRESVGMKQREVAHAIGWSAATVRAWESEGKRHRSMNRIAEAAFRRLIEEHKAKMDDDRATLTRLLPRAA